MPKQVRLRRGTTAQHASFAGADGEVTVDTTKRELVLHDGVTAGGKSLGINSNLLFQNTADSLNSSTPEVSLFGNGQGSLTVPANYLTAGKAVRAQFRGYISTTGTPGTLTLGLKFPSLLTGVVKTPPVSMTLGQIFAEAIIACRIGGASGTGLARIMVIYANDSTGAAVAYHASDTFNKDFTAAIAFDVTGTFASAGQTLRIESAILEAVR